MAIRYYPGSSGISFEQASPQGQPEVDNPFQEQDPDHIIITQLYMQRAACYRRPIENERCPLTVHPALAYFCEDSPRQPTGVADLVTWTRTWANRPTEVTDYDQIAVQMPARGAAFRFDYGSAAAPFNWYPYLAAKSYNLPRYAKIERRFYLIGTSRTGVTCDYSAVTSIPTYNETIYTGRDVTTGGAGPLSDDQYFGIASQNIGLFSGAVIDPGGSTGGSGNATYTGGTLSGGNYYIGQTKYTRYLGNIWEGRSTRITI